MQVTINYICKAASLFLKDWLKFQLQQQRNFTFRKRARAFRAMIDYLMGYSSKEVSEPQFQLAKPGDAFPLYQSLR